MKVMHIAQCTGGFIEYTYLRSTSPIIIKNSYRMTIKALVVSDYRSEQSSRPEAELFIGLQKTGKVDVTIMTFPDAGYIQKFENAGIKVIGYHPEKKISREAVKKIRHELKRGRYHILHLFNRRCITNGIFAARGLPVKVILYRGFTGGIYWYDPSAYLKYLHPRVNKVMCLAKSIEEHLNRQLFFNPDKAVTINKGHLPEWYTNVGPVDRHKLGFSDDDFIVTCVANSRKMKGIPYLIKATYHIPSNISLHILLVGNNMDTKEVLKLMEKSPLNDKIHILGFRKDAMNIVKASDVFILPSIFGEATTKALIEAMSLGIACIATTIPGNRDLIIDMKSGLAVKPKSPEELAQAVLKLYHNPELVKELGVKARDFVQNKFHTNTTVMNTLKLYEEMTD